MCNCGKKRSTLNTQPDNNNNTYHQKIQQPLYDQPAQTLSVQTKQTVMLQYTGKTALTVIGNVSRKKYRFNFPGDIQHIAPGDVTGMATIPVLKKV